MNDGVTRLLDRLRAGDHAAGDELLPLFYAELRAIAARQMNRERTAHTLEPTALVHEAWMRLFGADGPASFESRLHLLRTASKVMRRVLVDHARTRASAKRGSAHGERVTLDDVLSAFEGDRHDLVDLDDALEALAAQDSELASLVELRFFGGASMEDTARSLGVSLATAERRWRIARAWLAERLTSRIAGED